MKLNRGILAICILLSVWGGFFCMFPAFASAYGGGTQAERYPQTVTAAQFAQYAGEKLEAWDKDHWEMLMNEAPQQFEIQHYVALAELTLKGD